MSNIKHESSSSSDESLDVTSSKFDAMKALYSNKVKLPVPSAKPFDNMAKYESIAKRLRGELPEMKPISNEETASQSDLETAGTSQSQTSRVPKEEYQRFLPHQQMVRGKARKAASNLLTRMAAAPPPLQRLRQAAASNPRCRVRVVTRNERGVHGRLEGYVVLFDKHWNLAMADVTEVFYRTAPRRAKDFFVGR
ncbi:U7 snRNA-associated Sm-like protein LSm11 [Thrips palmi]|uniref:U7 snRNA-associated Sm-like protein LSm11 n=1 Tax=Thrips palmi TaxID=161013 RepID=A0A6P8YDC6_THRPL|nr:U7 snRNA-associated Sm-like protein LSm11 [Thrips palmi]